MSGVSREQSWNDNISVGIGYIGIPFGVDRDKFVKSCYRRNRVHVITDRGSIRKNCYIDSDVIQEIKFPETCESLGSQIVFVMDSFLKIPIVIANISRTRERVASGENQINIQRSYNGGLLSIVGSGEGKLLINLENSKSSKLLINLSGESSNLEINNKGYTMLSSNNDITINSATKVVKNVLNQSGNVQSSITLDQTGFKYEDDKGNVLFIDYENDKIIHNEGSQPIPLGTELKDQLDKLNEKFNTFLNTYSNTPVVPSDGGAAVQTAVKLAVSTLKDADFKDINSQKSFID